MTDGVDQLDQLPCLRYIAHAGKGHHHPDSGMSVLATILANAGNVSFDVTGIEIRPVERRIEQLYKILVSVHEVPVHRCHGGVYTIGQASARQYCLALRY